MYQVEFQAVAKLKFTKISKEIQLFPINFIIWCLICLFLSFLYKLKVQIYE